MKSLESLNGTDSFPIAYDMKLKRIRRGAYGISGSILMTDTLDDYTVSDVGFLCRTFRLNIIR